MTKLVKKAQLKGIAASAATNRIATRALIAAACKKVAATKRPSVDNVFINGAGAFGRSAVKDRDRHRDILEEAQRKWDAAHPDAKVRRAVGPVALIVGIDGETATPAAGAAEKIDAGAARAAASETELTRVKAQLDAAREAVEEADRRHRMDRAEIEELELRLERQRAEPRTRQPKRFADEDTDDKAAGGAKFNTGPMALPAAAGWGKPVMTYRLEGKWNG